MTEVLENGVFMEKLRMSVSTLEVSVRKVNSKTRIRSKMEAGCFPA